MGFLSEDSSVAVPGVASALRFNPNATFSRLGACTPETDIVACTGCVGAVKVDCLAAAVDDAMDAVPERAPEAIVDVVPPTPAADKLEGTALFEK